MFAASRYEGLSRRAAQPSGRPAPRRCNVALPRPAAALLLWVAPVVMIWGCTLAGPRTTSQPTASPDAATQPAASETAAPANGAGTVAWDGTAPAAGDAPDPGAASSGAAAGAGPRNPFELLAPRPVDYAVIHVQYPASQAARAAAVWAHIGEDFLDTRTALRLTENGFRVGVGKLAWWESVRAALEQIENTRVSTPEPVRTPLDYQLDLAFDTRPHDQTLFVVEPDGVLSGGTYLQSRNVLSIQGRSVTSAGAVRLHLAPQIQQDLEKWEYVRTPQGVQQLPARRKHAFEAVSFWVDIRPDEYLVLGPSERGLQQRLLGGAFLSQPIEGIDFLSMIFIRPTARPVVREASTTDGGKP